MADLEKVGLIFKADGSVDFVNSLRNVNSALNENYQQFRLTQSQWDKSTKTSEKLVDKMAYLNDAYDIQKKKVVTLTSELDQLEKAEIKDETAINKKKAALAQAETQLNKYGKQVEDTSKKIQSNTANLDDMANKLDSTGGALVSTGKKVSVYSAAVAAAGGMAIKSSAEFESAFAGVEKTSEGTAEQLKVVKQGIRDMALELPAGTTEISAVAEAAGQLGIKVDDVLDFTRVMIDMGVATNLSSEEAATTLAKFANVTKMSSQDFGRLGSTIVALGNNFATTEADIANMAMNLGSAGSQVGMTQAEIAAFATALSSVGVEAQAGGTAFSKVMIEMQLATETQSGALKDFARVAGMSSEEFTKAFKDDATGAIMAFVDGLSKSGEQGESAIKVLDDMGITETRLRDTLLRSANASEIFGEAIQIGSEAWKDNIALTEEAELRYQTTESQIAILKNTLNDVAIMFGDILLPAFKEFLDSIRDVLNNIRNMSPEMQKFVVAIGLIVAALGPALIFVGKIIQSVGLIVGAFAKLKAIVIPVFAAIKTAIVALSATLGLPVALVVAIGVAIAGLAVVVFKYWDQIKAATVQLFEWIKNNFNSLVTMFGNIVKSIKEKFSEILATINDIVTNVSESVEKAFNFILEKVSETVESFKEFFSSVVTSIVEFFTSLGESIREIAQETVEKLLEIFAAPIDFIKNALLLVVALFAIALETIYNSVILPLVNFIKVASDNIVESFTSGIENVKQFFSEAFIWIQENVVQPLVDFMTNSLNSIKDFTLNSLENIKDFFSKAFQWIQDKVVQPLVAFISTAFGNIKQFILNVLETIKQTFKNAFDWIKTSVISPLIGFFSGVFNSIKGVIDNSIVAIKSGFQSVSNFVKTVFEGVRDSVVNIFSAIGGVIKAPINGVISLINGVLRSLNKIKVPNWVPGLGGSGINFSEIAYLAKGGDLLSGQSYVAEAGPELLQQQGNKTRVTPLSSGGGAVKHDLIDYKKLAQATFDALSNLKLVVDDDGIGKLVDERLLGYV